MRLVLLVATFAIAGLAGVSSVAGAAEDHPILPGYWESVSKVSFPLPSSKTDRKCVSEDQINSYLTGPSNPHYTCHYDKRHVEDGQATMEGDCVDSGVHAKIKISGTYTATSFQLTSHLQAVLGGLQIPITASIEAHRLSGECPIGAKVEGGPKVEGGDRKEPTE
jgi:hypothetical protein